MLFGRSALAHGILVDPSKSYLVSSKQRMPRPARHDAGSR
jgi:hypothetical protein